MGRNHPRHLNPPRARIRALVGGRDPEVRATFEQFLTGIRSNLNDGITEDDTISMLSQHLVSRPVFEALFEDTPSSRSTQCPGRCRILWKDWKNGDWRKKPLTWTASTVTYASVCRG